jgi:hypothetical protein
VSAKRIVAPGIVCVALLAGLAVPGIASAAGSTPSTVTAKTQGHDHRLEKWLIAHRLQLRSAVLSISAKAIGLSRQDLATDLRSGQSIAAVADAHHVSTRSVVNALVGAADTELSKVSASHKLSSAQVTKIKQKLQTDVVKLVDHRFGQKAGGAEIGPATGRA